MNWLFWLIMATIFFVGELITIGFVLFWFGVGASVAVVLALLEFGIYTQSIAFLLVSAILVIFSKKITKRLFKDKEIPSNIFAIIGKQCIVTQEINNLMGTGIVKVSGELWTARSADDQLLEVGTRVVVVRVEGVKLIVQANIVREELDYTNVVQN